MRLFFNTTNNIKEYSQAQLCIPLLASTYTHANLLEQENDYIRKEFNSHRMVPQHRVTVVT